MAKGRIDITVSVEIDTGDDTPMEAVLEEINVHPVISKDVLMLETSDYVSISNPRIEEVAEHE